MPSLRKIHLANSAGRDATVEMGGIAATGRAPGPTVRFASASYSAAPPSSSTNRPSTGITQRHAARFASRCHGPLPGATSASPDGKSGCAPPGSR